ncbi:putative ribonuclease-like protein YfkH [Pullulanibacillus camelliae]|uniref:Putative ribonuclease-like protein YfkH n=1 Tax=Pullulanibacillus camelliae TaxID=1707096 RepID=A0A8J3DVM2_9BACL|nr:YihY/virulence factor BrkB family protein [Pullulanibacillus camelliae]GGE45252.1 putative ribonuclease-like protein YfkH [Pullulanibacillus camelliae]
MGKRSIPNFIKYLIKCIIEDRVFDLAAQLAYFFMLSLFPLLIFTFTLLPYFGISQDDITPFLERFAPPELMTLIKANLTTVFNKHTGILSFSVIATIWPMSTAINAIIRVLNRAYDVKENRSFIISRALAILLTLAMIFVLIIALVLNVFGPALGKTLLAHFEVPIHIVNIIDYIRLIFSFFVIIVVFAGIYLFAPNKKLHVGDVIIGAIFAAVLWQVASLAFSVYVKVFNNYSATYGTLGGIIVLMIWFYLTGFILILGGEINAALRLRRKKNGFSE